MAGKKGYIQWWKTKAYYYVHVLHNNGNINSPDKYKTNSGMYKRKKVLEKLYPGYVWRKNPLK